MNSNVFIESLKENAKPRLQRKAQTQLDNQSFEPEALNKIVERSRAGWQSSRIAEGWKILRIYY